MEIMTELEAITFRHSVRQYLDKPIEKEKIASIQQCVDECNAHGMHFQLITDEPKAFASGLAKYGKFSGVSNYLMLVAPKGKEGDELCGYYGAKLSLLIQILGMNSVFVGLTFRKQKEVYTIADGEELKMVLAFGYGETQGVQHPEKKTFTDVTENIMNAPAWFYRGVEASLLAPTAMLQQKFKFVLNGNTVEAKTTFALNHYPVIDLGIVKYFFEVAASKSNFNWK